MSNLNNLWQDYKENNLETIHISDFAYAEKQKETIREALCYWQFLKDQSWMQSSNKTDQKIFEDFVKEKSSHIYGQFIPIISIMFLLPSKVWRRILWRYNIDFLSHETFLRRLSNEQMEYIWDNYVAYQMRKILPVYKKSFTDYVTVLIFMVMKFLGIKKLQKSIKDSWYDNAPNKFETKGAWAYNLAFLDFGFSMYPNGIENDEIIADRSMSRFLSRKNHINDFVVNQDDGLYWFMYQFVRNWGFLSSNTVKLSPWICPGFWKTLLLTSWFVIGPIIALFMTPTIHGVWSAIIPSILALPFVLYTVVWLIILAIIVLGYIIPILKPVGVGLVPAIILIVCIVVGAVLLYAGVSAYENLVVIYKAIHVPYQKVMAIITVALWVYNIGLYVLYAMYKDDCSTSNNESYSTLKSFDDIACRMILQNWRTILLVSNIVFMLIVHAIYYSDTTFDVLRFILHNILWFISAVIAIVLTIYVLVEIHRVVEQQIEKEFVARRKELFVTSVILVIAATVFFLDTLIFDYTSNNWVIIPVLSIVSTAFVALIGLWITYYDLKNNLASIVVANYTASDRSNDNLSFFEYRKLLVQNPYLKKMSFEKASHVVEETNSIIEELFRKSNLGKYKARKLLLPYVNQNNINRLRIAKNKLQQHFTYDCNPAFLTISDYEKLFFIYQVVFRAADYRKLIKDMKKVYNNAKLSSTSTNDATDEYAETPSVIWEKFKSIIKWIFTPVTYVWRKLVQVIQDLKQLNDTFKNHCPRVQDTRNL